MICSEITKLVKFLLKSTCCFFVYFVPFCGDELPDFGSIHNSELSSAHPLNFLFISSIFAGILPRMPSPSFFMTKELPMNSLVIRIK